MTKNRTFHWERDRDEAAIHATELCRQLDSASGALAAFAVFQALAYAYTFGTNKVFNCFVKNAEYLAWALAIAFVGITLGMLLGLFVLCRARIRLASSHKGVVIKLYGCRAAVVAM